MCVCMYVCMRTGICIHVFVCGLHRFSFVVETRPAIVFVGVVSSCLIYRQHLSSRHSIKLTRHRSCLTERSCIRYYGLSGACSSGGLSAAFISVYHTVGNCNPTTKQTYSCSGKCVCVCVCVCVYVCVCFYSRMSALFLAVHVTVVSWRLLCLGLILFIALPVELRVCT